jgi:hypothetical protein
VKAPDTETASEWSVRSNQERARRELAASDEATRN